MGLDVVKPTADEALQNSATIMQNVYFFINIFIFFLYNLGNQCN